jgi:hypothetical protein
VREKPEHARLDATIVLRGAGKGFKKEKCRKVELNKFL